MVYNPRKARTLPLVYAAFYLIPTYLFFGSDPSAFGIYRLGQLMGILGITALCMQVALTARFMFVEQGVGMDRLTRLHKTNGLLLMVALTLHPTFIFWEFLWPPTRLWESVLSYTIYHWLGVAALILIFVQVATTIYSRVIKLNYELWKWIHRIGYLIVILAILHSLNLGADVQSPGPIRAWYFTVQGVFFFAVFYRHIWRPWKFRNSWYTVGKIVKETPDVRSIYLKPASPSTNFLAQELAPAQAAGPLIPHRNSLAQTSFAAKIRLAPHFSYAPGQFAFVRFKSEKVPAEEHHFTLSSTPSDPYLSFTIKKSGDFTAILDGLKVGDRARIEGPYGVFSNSGMKGPFVMIAGGIGITPIMSMLRTMQEVSNTDQATLLYVCSTVGDIVFKKELDTMAAKNKWFKVAYVLSGEKRTGFYEGRFSGVILEKEVDRAAGITFFVCGPSAMMDAAVAILKKSGVPSNKIFTEHFALR